MRFYIIIALLLIVSKTFGQTEFNKILKNVQVLNLPYNTEQGYSERRDKRKVLHSSDSLFLISRLEKKLPRTVNPIGDSPFGQIDCQNMPDCLQPEELNEIAILNYFIVNENNYLLHLELTEIGQFGLSFGILVSMTQKGEIIDWIFSDGSANGGNSNGNVSRSFLIQNDTTILIKEGSWGKNTTSYAFEATYKMAQNAENYNGDYENGEFELKSLQIDY